MTIITREKVRLPLHKRVSPEASSTGREEYVHSTYAGTLSYDQDTNTLDLVDATNGELIIRLTDSTQSLNTGEIRLLDVRPQFRQVGIEPEMSGALSALRVLGVITRRLFVDDAATASTIVEIADDLGVAAQAAHTRTATVTLFKDSGKYYTGEAWSVPVNAIGPYDMELSPDFRRIGGGAVLVDSDPAGEYPDAENWGFPQLLPSAEDITAALISGTK
jgi:hypothetical protein